MTDVRRSLSVFAIMARSGIDHLTSYVPPFHEAIGYTKEMMKEEMAGGAIRQGLGDRRITDHLEN